MPQDALMLKCVTEELNTLLSGGKINKIVQQNNDNIVLTVYKGKVFRLLISVDPSNPRINLLNNETDAPLTAPNFCMLLRKHLSSATIEKIELAIFDRIVKITFNSSQEFFDAKQKVMYVELMGRYSNIILTEDNKVLGANRGVNVFDNGVRPLIVNKPYVLAPTGEKREPKDQTLIDYFEEFSEKKGDLGEYIFGSVLGLSKITAGEIAHNFYLKYGSENSQNFGKNLYDFLNDFIYNSKPNPCIVKSEETIKDVLCFDYKTVEGKRQFFESVLDADNEYFIKKTVQKTYAIQKERLTTIVSTQIKKVKKRLSAILSRKKDAENAEQNRLFGELILANIYKVKKGDKTLNVVNYYDGLACEIPLNPDLSPSQNSNAYYKKYTKQKRALLSLESQENIAREELEYLSVILEEISLSETIKELLFVKEEMKNYGLIKEENKSQKKKEEPILRTYCVEGFTVLVGRNNIENDKITFSAKPTDIWLHAKAFHSSHVIIKNPTENAVPYSVIKTSAEICGYYSKARESGNTEIVFTLKKFVKKTPKGKPGSCIYTDFNSITIKPQKHEELIKK